MSLPLLSGPVGAIPWSDRARERSQGGEWKGQRLIYSRLFGGKNGPMRRFKVGFLSQPFV